MAKVSAMENGGHACDDRHCREHQCGYFQMQFLVLQYTYFYRIILVISVYINGF